MRVVRQLAAWSLCLFLLAPAWAQDPAPRAAPDPAGSVLGLWKISGTDGSRGKYAGDVDFIAASAGLTATAVLKYADGRDANWAGTARQNGNLLVVEYVLAPTGALDRLDLDTAGASAHPAPAKKIKGEFRLTPSGKSLIGKFSSEDDRSLGGAAEMTRRVTRVARVYPEKVGAPLLDPFTISIFGRDLPPKNALAPGDISFGDANITVEEIVSVNTARSQIKVKLRLRHGTATGKKDVTVKGVTGSQLLDVLPSKNVFVGLGDGNTDGVPWDEYIGDWGIRSLMKDLKAIPLASGRDGPWYHIDRKNVFWYFKLALDKKAFAEGMAFEGSIGAFDGHAHSGVGPSWPPVETTEYFMGADGADIHLPGAARFAAFLYNGCWSMRYFSDVLTAVNPTGAYFGCNDMANASESTGWFIKMMMQGKTPDDIVRKLNTFEGAGDISYRAGR
ncbi:MAG: hypothetical protein HYZ53_26890 [Planctomycetes bacterium]|nr:hypothetical protein [Planctomycetota bacterium]